MRRLLGEPPKSYWGLTEWSLIFFVVGSSVLVAAFNMTELRDWLPGAILGGFFFCGGLIGLIASVIRDRRK
jgi:hypothetical protein